MSNLAYEFRQALQSYLRDMNQKENQRQLVLASYRIYEEFVINQKLTQADDFWPKIQELLQGCSLESIKVSDDTLRNMAVFIRQLTWSEDDRVCQSFHALNMAYTQWLSKQVVSQEEETIRFTLDELEQSARELLTRGERELGSTIEGVYQQLKEKTEQHFALPEKEQKHHYHAFASEIKQICAENKQSIDQDIRIRTVVHNLLAAVLGLGIFYGIYLLATASNRNTFFLQPKEVKPLENTARKLDALHEKLIDDDDSPPSLSGKGG
ncbi:hypothetical protein [Legionella oakridgensis]|uniref:hypothetical protein n=1 Tax=Legionella oakridgensis TaxID=29423 RepID=UPI0003DE1F40|nr:hypothetical protein [Legionella oakridgensis]ETO92701.1 hypothetical protein LOR_40c04850 [Legionella oakridgensis RV-2-2007]